MTKYTRLDFLKNLLICRLRFTETNFINSFHGTCVFSECFRLLRQLQKLTYRDYIFHKTLNWSQVVFRHLLNELEKVVLTDKPFLLGVNQQEKEFEQLRHNKPLVNLTLAEENTLDKINVDSYFYIVRTGWVQCYQQGNNLLPNNLTESPL